MIPSQYNYLKRSFTRTMSNRGEGIISKIILFPFRLMILVFLLMLYAGFLIIYYGTQILFKLFFELLKLLFKFLKFLFVLIIKSVKILLFYKKDNIKYDKNLDITSIMRKYKVSYNTALKIKENNHD